MNWRRLCGLLGTLAVAALAAGYWYFYDSLNVQERSFRENQALVVPHIQILLPAGPGPHPAVLFFHGCGGLQEFSLPRARETVAQGYAAIIVDSFTGRNLDWRLTCSGRALQGGERAADVITALEHVRTISDIDHNNMFLMGFSHGGWTVMESLAYGDALPPGLLDSPGNHLRGVRGVIAWYPYCGFGVEFAGGWDSELPVLMLLAAEDQTTDPQPCIDVAQLQSGNGKIVDWEIYAGVDHGFDVQASWTPVYDPVIKQQAMAAQHAFLAEHTARPAPIL
jgi:dienelactone hydrolase